MDWGINDGLKYKNFKRALCTTVKYLGKLLKLYHVLQKFECTVV